MVKISIMRKIIYPLFVFVFILGFVSCAEKNGEYKKCYNVNELSKLDLSEIGLDPEEVKEKFINDELCKLSYYNNDTLISVKFLANNKLIYEGKEKSPNHYDFFGYSVTLNKYGDTLEVIEKNDSIEYYKTNEHKKNIMGKDFDSKTPSKPTHIKIVYKNRSDITEIQSIGWKGRFDSDLDYYQDQRNAETFTNGANGEYEVRIQFTDAYEKKTGIRFLERVYDSGGKIIPEESGFKDKNFKWIGRYSKILDKWEAKDLKYSYNNWNRYGQ